jgi:hypothetical protein
MDRLCSGTIAPEALAIAEAARRTFTVLAPPNNDAFHFTDTTVVVVVFAPHKGASSQSMKFTQFDTSLILDVRRIGTRYRVSIQLYGQTARRTTGNP